MANIEIGGRLHSTATGNVVTGANEVLDDTKNKKQSVINAEVDETIGDDNTAGTIKGRIKTAEGKLDTLNGDSSTSGSVAKAVADAKTELIGGATSNGNTLKKVEDRTATLETAVGSNGSVDQRIAAAKSEVIGDAASDYNTLGKLEDKIQAEASARQDAITAETNRATTRENQIYDLVHTPEQHYVTVATYADLANISSPSDDTVYRVSSYNGKTSQVDNTVYSEYGYDGTNFVFLCVKSQIDEVYDISAHHSNNTYVDLAAALDGGNNIPQELRRGGMSVKFVQSSDNKYVQYRLMSDTFNTTVANWQGADDEPIAGSDNLVKSGGVHSELYTRNEIGYEFNSTGTNKIAGYITENGDIGSPTSTSYFVHYFPISIGDKFLLNYESFTSSSGRAYAIYSTDNPNELSSDTVISVGPVGSADTDFNIEITDLRAKLLCISTHKSGGVYNDWNAKLTKILYVSKFQEEKNNTIARLIASRDYTISGNVVYDTNEIPQSYDIMWSDGTIGTVVMSNFNYDVFEYTTITATYGDKTIIYSLTYDLNGYITNETFNIQ